jgi:hypothetical protein
MKESKESVKKYPIKVAGSCYTVQFFITNKRWIQRWLYSTYMD